jgi:hypothetical protein
VASLCALRLDEADAELGRCCPTAMLAIARSTNETRSMRVQDTRLVVITVVGVRFFNISLASSL